MQQIIFIIKAPVKKFANSSIVMAVFSEEEGGDS
jgi:hypothetical protein